MTGRRRPIVKLDAREMGNGGDFFDATSVPVDWTIVFQSNKLYYILRVLKIVNTY